MTALEQKLATEEAQAMSAEEKGFADAALAALPEAHRAHFQGDEEGVLLVVRGFASEKDRMNATISNMQMISEWREKIGFYDRFNQPIPGADQFHGWWPERIHGTDTWGHVIQSLRIEEINTDKIASLSDEQIEQYQGQRLKSYASYKQQISRERGVQRYKHTLIIDLKHVSMSMLAGSKRHTIQRIFHVGSTYFPETMWRIYLVNPPMVFRAIWAIIKNFLHPLTINKVHFCANYKDAMKRMVDEQIPLQALPHWIGGESKGITAYDFIKSDLAGVK
eukprot:CAMPEP_0181314692 /NCGR_PEP_ID=MMETSP1101-20121128/14957_1 /TAXON_ID=46948 /ORGANISM="Rhodomonas abbreviata, Strain Caron Lab Isolate" /LENGTH=277 /DNA_ID=CAMNT_0023421809 /DNA_START=115 /DNA_END=948 /DNA_ORIENTATION=-